MRYFLILALFLLSFEFIESKPIPILVKKSDPTQIAIHLIEKPDSSFYVNRLDAITMDDNPKIREELKKICVNRGYMYEYQSSLFDDGFGQACQALRYARKYYLDSLPQPETFEIKR